MMEEAEGEARIEDELAEGVSVSFVES